jgi:hypothetical protein
MILGAVLDSLMQLDGHAQHHEFKNKIKSLIKINLAMNVGKIWYIEMCDYNL